MSGNRMYIIGAVVVVVLLGFYFMSGDEAEMPATEATTEAPATN